jgi:carbonic anhydrase/acetyltransferase-like protein (isoleucine patch superfamily)
MYSIHYNVIIGDNCVLHTASCLPNGLPADLTIIQDCVISPGCTLYSCYLDHGCFIGANSVIL